MRRGRERGKEAAKLCSRHQAARGGEEEKWLTRESVGEVKLSKVERFSSRSCSCNPLGTRAGKPKLRVQI